ncbi:hypothetical protein Ddc_02265 [Ditylenchus destructor]|nr:hypothetical protein Ddc_02265 [Ditylenchus destructor]
MRFPLVFPQYEEWVLWYGGIPPINGHGCFQVKGFHRRESYFKNNTRKSPHLLVYIAGNRAEKKEELSVYRSHRQRAAEWRNAKGRGGAGLLSYTAVFSLPNPPPSRRVPKGEGSIVLGRRCL